MLPVELVNDIPHVKRVVFFEICAGSAKLSSCMRSRGFHSISVDWLRNRRESFHPIVKLDLTISQQVQTLLEFICKAEFCILWFALPCGTCSRAREIKLAGVSKLPQQLRSKEFPRGCPNLSPTDTDRVLKANQIYDNCFVLIELAISRGFPVAIENPSRSWLWSICCFDELLHPTCS